MNCPHCKEEGLKASVLVRLYVDAEDVCKITKQVLRKKETELVSKDDKDTRLFCSHCGYDSVIAAMQEKANSAAAKKEQRLKEIARRRREAILDKRYVIVRDNTKEEGLLYYQNHNISNKADWTKFRSNALGFKTLAEAEAVIAGIKYKNTRTVKGPKVKE